MNELFVIKAALDFESLKLKKNLITELFILKIFFLNKVTDRNKKLKLETCLFRMIKLSTICIFLKNFVHPYFFKKLCLFNIKMSPRKERVELKALFSLDHFFNIESFATDLFQSHIHESFFDKIIHPTTNSIISRLNDVFLGKFSTFTDLTLVHDERFCSAKRLATVDSKYYFDLRDFDMIFGAGVLATKLTITMAPGNYEIIKILKRIVGHFEVHANRLKNLEIRFSYELLNYHLDDDAFTSFFQSPDQLGFLEKYNYKLGRKMIEIFF